MKTKIKIGYKASRNGICRGFKYEVGKTYQTSSNVKLCYCGFHYCEKLDNVFHYYPYKKNKTLIFEIEDLGTGETDGIKSVTNKIRIVREIPVSEWNSLVCYSKFDEHENLIEVRGTDDLFWAKYKYDTKDRLIERTYNDGAWRRSTYDDDNKIVKYNSSDGVSYIESYDENSTQY